ncbi:hypothetical protein TNCV_2795041 [Trichonephila clavipes]|nr:hypothetical protein TNCV_2795041 [Trichonephila clavipes]
MTNYGDKLLFRSEVLAFFLLYQKRHNWVPSDNDKAIYMSTYGGEGVFSRQTFGRQEVCPPRIQPLRDGGTLNKRRAISPQVRLVEGEDRWEDLDPQQSCSISKLEWIQTKSYCHLYDAQGDG